MRRRLLQSRPTPESKKIRWWQFVRKHRARAQKRFDTAVQIAVAERQKDILAEAVKLLPYSFTERLTSLTGEVTRLRQERRQYTSPWITIAVHLHGFRPDPQNQQDFYVLVEINQKTGVVRAASDPKWREILHGDAQSREFRGSAHWHTGGGWDRDLLFTGSELGAPQWHKIDGHPNEVYLLGQTYTYRGESRMTGMA